ncbi:MAG: hypothetical protein Q8K97_13440 [Pseudohongiella sp.]|nr:hypothetical protein [Pseudohongiella sp.]
MKTLRILLTFSTALHFLGWCSTVFAETGSALSLSVSYHNNIPNAVSEPDIFGDSFTDINYRLDRFFVASPGNRLSVGTTLRARQYRHSQGLESISAGLAMAYSHRAGLGAYAPRFNISFELARYEFSEAIRDAWLASLDMNMSKRISPEWLLTLGLLFEDRDAKTRSELQFRPDFTAGVFDQKSATVSGRLDYTLPNYSLLSFGYRFRDGDIEASSRPGSPLLLVAKAIARDTGLGRNYVAYLIEARSHSFSVDWAVAVTDNSSIGIGYQRSIADAGRGIEYDHNNVRAEYTLRF